MSSMDRVTFEARGCRYLNTKFRAVT
uniref:Uncharacterized protein n=1 Tax=Solanum lycopersicum TaxID=4081 RepID=A0A3Q7ILY7_SOLLC